MRQGVLLVASAVVGCVDADPGQRQARPEAYRESAWFSDQRAMRPEVPHTLSLEAHRARLSQTGPDELPVPRTRALHELGRQRFEVFCAPCHGLLGDGRGLVARKLRVRAPPDLLTPHSHGLGEPSGAHLPHLSGFYFAVISNGFGLMPSYREQLSPEERWAVVAHLQALSRSQRVRFEALPPSLQARLLREAP